MTLREKIAHLYRRLGFGATPAELDEGVRVGLRETARRLIDYEKVDEQFPISPHEFSFREKEEPDLSTYRYRLWWITRMLVTKRPLQERLTLFWHNHFAVSDAKVEDGPMMLNYLEALRTNACGPFLNVLTAASKDPAMMRYLDMQRSMRGNPNENFAREVMELFTLGIGNYTETDVKEAARAFTGWGYVHIFWELPGNTDAKVHDWLAFGRPFSSFTLMPAMHDPLPKKLLGVAGQIDGDKALEIMAKHPATARRICKKLWEHFAYENPEPAVIEKLSSVYRHTNGNIASVMHAVVDSPEFWSDRCVRKLVKSPVDLCISIARQMGAGEHLMSFRSPHATEKTPIPQTVLDNLWGISDRMERCGLSIFYPPDVSGWHWGKAWISSAAMLERYRYRGMFIYGQKGPDVGSQTTLAFVKSRQPKDSDDIARALTEFFDLDLPETAHAVLAESIHKRGGPKVMDNMNAWAGNLDHTLMLMMATPETHMA